MDKAEKYFEYQRIDTVIVLDHDSMHTNSLVKAELKQW